MTLDTCKIVSFITSVWSGRAGRTYTSPGPHGVRVKYPWLHCAWLLPTQASSFPSQGEYGLRVLNLALSETGDQQPSNCRSQGALCVLKSDCIHPIPKRDLVSSHVGPSIDAETQRGTEDKEQADGRPHSEERVWGTTFEINLG